MNGQWHKGKYTKGTTTYEGTFDNGITGKFLVEWTESGNIYDGMLESDKLNGEGLMTFNEGPIASI